MTEPLIPAALASCAPLKHPALPQFKCVQPKLGVMDFSGIAIGDTIFHRIADSNAFFSALGYNTEIHASGWQPDEFIWDRYTRDGASKSRHCLQMQIAAYLYRNSATFVRLYGSAFGALIASCSFECMDDDVQCLNCPLHPQGHLRKSKHAQLTPDRCDSHRFS